MAEAELRYDDDYAVERFDRVDFLVDDLRAEGVITKIHPQLRQVTVRYEDWQDCYRTTAKPRRKTLRLPVARVELIARDG